MRLSASLAVALLLLYSQFASAQQSPQFLPNTGISIERAVIEADLLHVNGTTLNPGTVVTLDGQFMTTTGADRKFDFSVDYLPETCVIEIRTGSMADPVVVRPCGMERGKDQSAPIPKAPKGVFDGRFGFFKAHVQDERYDFAFARVTEGLGETWEALNIAPKAYPCGHYNQPLIYAASALREQHDITSEQISTIRCSIPEYVIPLVAEPLAEKRRPKTSFHGRFSLQHSVAEAMIQGTLDKSSFDTRNLTDPRYNDLADKVQAVIDPLAIDRSQLGGLIEVELYDGRIFSRNVKHMLGTPQNPMSESDLARKFQMNASGTLPSARVDRITNIIMSLERVDNIGTLMDEL